MERIEYRGHIIELDNEDMDLAMFDPRSDDSCNMGTMACAHRRYELGDEQVDPSDMTVECPACEGSGELDGVTTEEHSAYGERLAECPKCEGSGEVTSPVEWAKAQGATVVLPLYLYDHSGITMRTSGRLYPEGEESSGNPFHCRWDSGMVGIIFDTPDGIKQTFGQHVKDEESGKYVFTGKYLTEDGEPPSVERIEAILRDEVRVYDAFLTGDIARWNVEGDYCNDGCGGYFPDLDAEWSNRWDHVIAEAKESIDNAIEREQQEVAKIRTMMAL